MVSLILRRNHSGLASGCVQTLIECFSTSLCILELKKKYCLFIILLLLYIASFFFRYLGSGCTFMSLSLYFQVGHSTVAEIIAATTLLIWQKLKDEYMKIPNNEDWKNISNRFYEVWNIPNCLGAIDGKHIRIEQLPNSGSTNFNYKQYHSIVLMAVCDADGLFTMVETGFAGRNNDGGIFRESRMHYWLERNGLNIPENSPLPHDESQQDFPFYFVGDNAFPLKQYTMRPYPLTSLDNKKRIFNYRLSRARKTIECSFGMMTEKFQVLGCPIRCRKIKNTVNIIKAVCILHNFVRKREGSQYTISINEPTRTTNRPQIILQEEVINLQLNSGPTTLRKYLTNYFIKPRVALPWQNKYCY